MYNNNDIKLFPVWPLQKCSYAWHTETCCMDLCFFSYHSVKDIVGYDPEVILATDANVDDFLHPSDYDIMLPMRKFCKWGTCFLLSRRLCDILP